MGITIVVYLLCPFYSVLKIVSNIICMGKSSDCFLNGFNRLAVYTLCIITVWILFKKLNIFERLSAKYYNLVLLLSSSVIMLIILSPVYWKYCPFLKNLKGYTTFLNYSSYVVETFLYIACAKILIGIEPINNLEDKITKKKLSDFDKNLIFLGFAIAIYNIGPFYFVLGKINDLICMFISWDGLSREIQKFISFILSVTTVWILFDKIKVFKRLSIKYHSFLLFYVSFAFFIIDFPASLLSELYLSKLYLYNENLYKIYYYTSIITKTCLYIACARILIGIEPIKD
ncbi:MAG: hypothetical protein ACQESN_11495 [Thermotogota bacterium]